MIPTRELIAMHICAAIRMNDPAPTLGRTDAVSKDAVFQADSLIATLKKMAPDDRQPHHTQEVSGFPRITWRPDGATDGDAVPCGAFGIVTHDGDFIFDPYSSQDGMQRVHPMRAYGITGVDATKLIELNRALGVHLFSEPATADTHEKLTAELLRWFTDQNIPAAMRSSAQAMLVADDLLAEDRDPPPEEPRLTREQRAYLRAFVRRWERAQ
jgi:hypothetical protein